MRGNLDRNETVDGETCGNWWRYSEEWNSPSWPLPCPLPPSSYNPFNITQLSEFNASLAALMIGFPGFRPYLCQHAASLLKVNAAEELVSVISTDETRWHLDVAPELNPPLLNLMSFASIILPYPFNNSGPSAIVDWWANGFLGNRDHVLWKARFIGTIARVCNAELCYQTGFVGNADLMGIGMLISILILMSITVVYTLVLAISSFYIMATKRTKGPVITALHSGLDDFLHVVLIYTMAVQISALAIRNQPENRIDSLQAEAISIFASTALAAFCTHFLQLCRQRPYTLLAVPVSAVLNIATFATAKDTDAKPGTAFERLCLGELHGWNRNTYTASITFYTWIPMALAALLSLKLTPQKVDLFTWVGLFYVIATTLPTVLFLNAMAVNIQYVHEMLAELRSVFDDTFTSVHDNWGFGQILALTTWVPPVLDLLFTLFTDKAKAYTRRLPTPWVATLPGDSTTAAPSDAPATAPEDQTQPTAGATTPVAGVGAPATMTLESGGINPESRPLPVRRASVRSLP